MDIKLCDQVVSIFIEPGSRYSYVSLDLVDKCGLSKEVHVESWLVQLATSTKKRVYHWVISCAFELNGMPTSLTLRMIPLQMLLTTCPTLQPSCTITFILLPSMLSPIKLLPGDKPHQVGNYMDLNPPPILFKSTLIIYYIF